MTKSSTMQVLAHPWEMLPPELAEILRPELASLADEIVEEIRRCVPEFDRPLRGQFGTGILLGVEQGLRQFTELIADPSSSHEQVVNVCRELGRGEYHAGRDLDALQAAYRVGARIAWRRFATVGLRAGLTPDTMCVLAEAVFAYIEELAAYSVKGFSELRARTAGTLQRRRHRLLELLLADPPTTARDRLVQLAEDAQWRLPTTVACVALDGLGPEARPFSPAVGAEVLMDLERPDPCLLIPDADGPGRHGRLASALRDSTFAIGPSVPLPEAALSLRLARQALALVRRGIIECDHYVRCVDHLPTLLLFGNEDITQLMIRRRYRRLAQLKEPQRERLSETLLTWLATGGSTPEIGALLCVHPQTVRYRMHQLEEIFGPRLRDAGWRFEMGIVLRTQLMLDAAGRSALTRRPASPPPL
ncbi:MAG: PucR C-terminal helix-turn-helix protein [Actinomycetia bacterium]|nr:PucR C-terminal helix-turn-helix protein [Actinomycetes bacterium]